MSGPKSSKELDRLKQPDPKAPVARAPTSMPNRNVVMRGNSAHSKIAPPPPPPPPPAAADGDPTELVIEMSGDDDDDEAGPARSRTETLADPETTAKLAEAARGAPPPAPSIPDGPNRHVKRRGG